MSNNPQGDKMILHIDVATGKLDKIQMRTGTTVADVPEVPEDEVPVIGQVVAAMGGDRLFMTRNSPVCRWYVTRDGRYYKVCK